MPVDVVMVRYGEDRYPDALSELERLLTSIGCGHARIIVVDNKSDGSCNLTSFSNFEIVNGDNTAWEFSGWTAGIAKLSDRGPQPKLYILTTDAFVRTLQTPEDSYADNTKSVDSVLVMNHDIVLGLLDPIHFYRVPSDRKTLYRLSNWRFDHWLRTAFFFIPRTILDKLMSTGGIVTFSNIDEYCPIKFSGHLFHDNADVNDSWRSKLEQWITRDWHNRKALTEENWPFLRQKIQAIMNEHAFNCRLRDLGVTVMDLRLLRWTEGRVDYLRRQSSMSAKAWALGSTIKNSLNLKIPFTDRLFVLKYFFSILGIEGDNSTCNVRNQIF